MNKSIPSPADEPGFFKEQPPEHPGQDPQPDSLRIARKTLQMVIPTIKVITPDMINHAFILTPPSKIKIDQLLRTVSAPPAIQ